jgi:pyruvate/2-oxoglutarate dehydrogenase complex dihydrolipoamide acyltransferase (E2) component
VTVARFPAQRRHTLYFLGHVAAFSPVFLDTEVDMTEVLAHRQAAREAAVHYSLVSYVLHAAGRTLAAHPDANAAIAGGRVARYAGVSGKLTLDKRLGGRRVVLAAVLPGLDSKSLDDIQELVVRYRDGDPDTMPEFAPVRAIDKLPLWLGRRVFDRSARSLARRPAMMGTFAVTSLGHRPVDAFHSVGGTTITLGVGRVLDRPVVRDGAVTVAPVLRLSLAFDHRVIDGAEAADVLTDIKGALEDFKEPTSIDAP